MLEEKVMFPKHAFGPQLTARDWVTTIALNGGCLGSGIDEDRS